MTERQQQPLSGEDMTIHEILILPAFADAEVLGGSADLDRVVRSVRLIASDHAAGPDEPDVALFMPHAQTGAFEVAVARFANNGATAIVTTGAPLLSTIWLAERLHLPLIRLAHDDLLKAALEAALYLREESTLRGHACAEIAHRLSRSGDHPHRVVTVLGDTLHTTVSITGGSIHLAGPPLPANYSNGTSGATQPVEDTHTLVAVTTPPTRSPTLPPITLVAWEPADCRPARVRLVTSALEIASLRVQSWMAQAQLSAAHDQASQSALLTELLAGPTVSPATARKALAKGWRLAGNHIAVVATQERSLQGQAPTKTESELALREELATQDGAMPIPFGDGWLWWKTITGDVTSTVYQDYVRATKSALRHLAPYAITAGMSRPRLNLQGLHDAINEAQHLCRLSGVGPNRRRLEHATSLNPRLTVLSALSDENTIRRAQLLIEPLTQHRDNRLLATLETYLATECSTTATARSLGVHRNTILRRLTAIESQLGVHLSDPDTRLALRLACRARIGSPDGGGQASDSSRPSR